MYCIYCIILYCIVLYLFCENLLWCCVLVYFFYLYDIFVESVCFVGNNCLSGIYKPYISQIFPHLAMGAGFFIGILLPKWLIYFILFHVKHYLGICFNMLYQQMFHVKHLFVGVEPTSFKFVLYLQYFIIVRIVLYGIYTEVFKLICAFDVYHGRWFVL